MKLASASADTQVKVWDVLTGKVLITIDGHDRSVSTVAFSSDGAMLATGAEDGVKLWEVSTGREIRTLVSYSRNPLCYVAFSPDNRILASTEESVITLWSVESGRRISELKSHTGVVTSLSFSSDGNSLASGSTDKTTKLWDVVSGSRLRDIANESGEVQSVALNRANTILAVGRGGTRIGGETIGNEGAGVTLYDVSTGKKLRSLPASDSVIALAFNSDGQTVLTATATTIQTWDVGTGRSQKVFTSSRGGSVDALTTSSDGKWLATNGDPNRIMLWNLESGELSRTLEGPPKELLTLAFSPDGTVLVSSGYDNKVQLWNPVSGEKKQTLILSEDGGSFESSHVVTFSNDGKLLAASNGVGISLWDASTLRAIRQIERTGPRMEFLKFSSDDKLLAGCDRASDGISVFDVRNGTKVREMSGGLRPLSFAFVNHDRTVAAGYLDGMIRLWNVQTGEKASGFNGEDGKSGLGGGHINAIATDRSGDIFASGGDDHTIKLWDSKTGREIGNLAGHAEGAITSLVFHGNGRFLWSGSQDGSVKLWDLSTGEELATLVTTDSREWIVTTPDGLFDGSPSAWNKILWRFENNTFDYAPLEAFFSDFYRPGLLTDILAGKRPQAPSDISQKDRRQPKLHLALANARADAASSPSNVSGNPTVREGARDVAIKIDIAESAADQDHRTGSGAQDVRLFRNGSLVKLWRGDVLNGKSSVTVEATIPIVAGENKFTAYAFNHDNIKSSDAALTVTGADSLKRKGTLRILAVGVSQYANREYNLNYTTDDATSFASQLKLEQAKRTQYQSVEIKTLLNESATKANILAELKKLAASAQPEDGVVVYFSGHGKADGDRFYLVPHDLGYQGSRDQLSSDGLKTILTHGISDQELEEAFSGIDAGQMFMIIDACNSGQALENKDEPRRGPMNTRGLAQLAYEKGMYIMTASQNVEEAFVSARLKHSYLTYALVEEGLKTKAADADHNGEVNLREWFDYALARVPKLREETLQSKSLEAVTSTMKAARAQKSQTPRVFYRREPDGQPMIVATVH
jgi:WD40 repeat protein